MNCEKMIKITDVQTDEETGETESVEITAVGTIKKSKGGCVLDFDEYFAEDMKSHTVFTVKNSECVSIVRTGDVMTELLLELGKRHVSVYSTPYGDLNVGIYTKEIENNLTETGGTIRLCYTIDYSGVLSATKKMLIEVK